MLGDARRRSRRARSTSSRRSTASTFVTRLVATVDSIGRLDGENYTVTIDRLRDASPTQPSTSPPIPRFSELNGGVFIDPVISGAGHQGWRHRHARGRRGHATLTVTGIYSSDDDIAPVGRLGTATRAVRRRADPPGARRCWTKAPTSTPTQTASRRRSRTSTPRPAAAARRSSQQLITTVIDLILGVISALLLTALLIALLGRRQHAAALRHRAHSRDRPAARGGPASVGPSGG